MRILGVFEKSERLRHIGHLDLMRAMQRALRRSGLPVSYSKGFNPHINVTFASALSVGAIGKREIMDVSMEGEVTAEEFLQVMNKSLPPELQFSFARAVDDRHPGLMAMVAACDYDIEIMDESAKAWMPEAVRLFGEAGEVMADRKTKSGIKSVDIKPLVKELTIEGGTLHAVMVQTEAQGCKPDMLLTALTALAGQEEKPRVMVTRNALLGCDESGSLVPLENL
ncbi:MAG: TIGR03936 family radical SAM-associated protein [Clostridia bacterium]|nr:TIGR03936 family radical SAM-associated protein [Clostridia bacterium]